MAIEVAGTSTNASAATWHYGTPKWAHGYWHDRGKYSNTVHIFKNNYWFRISGWNRSIKHHPMRFPWHGYTHVKYQGTTSDSMWFKVYNPQTGKHQYIALTKDSKNVIEMSNYENSEFGTYYKLYRDIR